MLHIEQARGLVGVRAVSVKIVAAHMLKNCNVEIILE